MSRDKRNSGAGRNLDTEFTIGRICQEVSNATKRGSGLQDKLHSALCDFAGYVHEKFGLRDIDRVEMEHYQSWVESLVSRVEEYDIKSGTAVDYVSAMNSLFSVFGVCAIKDLRINPSDHDLHKTRISNTDRSIDRATTVLLRDAALERYRETGDIRDAVVFHLIGVAHETGERCREAIMGHLADKDLSENVVSIRDKGDGAKNAHGREFVSVRALEWTIEAQMFLREHAHTFTSGNFIWCGARYREVRTDVDNRLRSLNAEIGNTRMWHGFRHDYAHSSYAQKWEDKIGHRIQCPVKERLYGEEWIKHVRNQTGLSRSEVRSLDHEIRHQMMEELGHHRSEDSSAYLGR